VKNHLCGGCGIRREDDAKAGASLYNLAMKLFRTLRNIISRHPLTGYGALVLLAAGSAFFVQHPYWGLKPPPLNAPFSMTLALLVIIPLAWRRFFLVLAFTLLAATLVTIEVLDVTIGVNLSSIALIMAVFSASAYGGRWRNLACTASIVTFNGGLLYKLMFSGNFVFLSSVTLFNIIGLLWILVTSFAIWWFGNTLRLSRERTSVPVHARNRLYGKSKECAMGLANWKS
jgi:hypothetical protein